jgi:hypothetical protein
VRRLWLVPVAVVLPVFLLPAVAGAVATPPSISHFMSALTTELETYLLWGAGAAGVVLALCVGVSLVLRLVFSFGSRVDDGETHDYFVADSGEFVHTIELPGYREDDDDEGIPFMGWATGGTGFTWQAEWAEENTDEDDEVSGLLAYMAGGAGESYYDGAGGTGPGLPPI